MLNTMKNHCAELWDEIFGHGITPKWILIGAYGRTYKNVQEAAADFMDGKDFMIYQGPYCSIRDWTGEDVYVFCSGKFEKLNIDAEQ